MVVGGCRESQFAEDAADVVFDGSFAEEEGGGGAPVGAHTLAAQLS